ncbi:MAG: flavodoxin domain-containing protein, partial [Verrucomicrobiota bacterium]|nr:flavodoxin domain-containing protein [Verrucomicrobiota bacterium]
MINLPENAPFDDAQRGALSELLGGYSAEQRSWLGSYLAGDSKAGGTAGSGNSLAVLYGTESGNSETLAARTAKLAKASGLKARLYDMAETKPGDLAQASVLLVVVSTWGEGDPPEGTEEYYRTFMAGGIDLSGLRYSVCALGDTSYEHFCKIGKDFDHQLEKLGAKRVAPRADCDVEFEETYEEWVEGALKALGAGVAVDSSAATPEPVVREQEYGKKNPFPSKVLEKVLLNGPGTKKETWHLELSLDGSGLSYAVGDSLAVVPTNAGDVVQSLLDAAGLSGEEEVESKLSGRKGLREALTSDYDITALSRKVAKAWQRHSGSVELAELLGDENKEKFKKWIWGRQIMDLLREFPAEKTEGQQLVD